MSLHVSSNGLCDACYSLRREHIEKKERHAHIRISDLKSTFKKCGFCLLLARAICRSVTGLEAQELDLDLALTKKLWKKDSDFLDETRYLLLDYSNAFNRLDIIAEDPSNPYAYDLLGIVALYQMMGPWAIRPSRAKLPLRHYHLSTTFDDAELFLTITSWMEKCLHNHLHINNDDFLPTRLLHLRVDNDGELSLRLIETKNAKVNRLYLWERGYVALSHTWGMNTMLRTTKANLQSHLIGIPTKSLSRTFRDAIDTCKALRFNYLWIDSLCIIQDDKDDWFKEAQIMGDVYANAYLTIAASAARDGSEGFLNDRVIARPIQLGGPQPFFATDGVTLENDADKSPLNSRAWVFQERILSPRTLHFTKCQAYWECRDSEVQQEIGYSAGIKRWGFVFDLSWGPETEFPNAWREIVDSYSLRELTYETDRLIALTGLIKRLSMLLSHFGDEYQYFYGMWKHQLPKALVWLSTGSRHLRTPAACWHAPSWSWAGHNGPIRSLTRTFWKPAMQILQLPPAAIFAEDGTKDAPLLVRAQLRELPTIGQETHRHPECLEEILYGLEVRAQQDFEFQSLVGDDGDNIGWVALDQGPKSSSRYQDCWCALTCYEPHIKGAAYPHHFALVLQPVDENSETEFIRIGLACIEVPGWFVNTPEKDFIIL